MKKNKNLADKILSHPIWDDYHPAIEMEFNSIDRATKALSYLGSRWRRLEKKLYWDCFIDPEIEQTPEEKLILVLDQITYISEERKNIFTGEGPNLGPNHIRLIYRHISY